MADESCAVPVIRALRAVGHDVLAIAGSATGASDEAMIARGRRGVLITADRDFGELVYARGHSAAGAMFLKFPERHKGYGSAHHISVLTRFGPLPFHRWSLAPVWRAGRVQPQLTLWETSGKAETN